MPVLNFSANAKSENPTKTVVTTDRFTLTVDEPESLGGTDTGPNPVQYVLAALAGCLNVMCHIVAKEMGFALRGVEIELNGDLDPDKLFGKDTRNRAGYSIIRVVIRPDADADPGRLADWLSAVERRCPVSDNLANTTPVNISLG